MKVFKIAISSWTASFRYPNLIYKSQPTLRVPPLSTIFGIISSAKGEIFKPKEGLSLAYYFDYMTADWDLETIYKQPNHDSDVIKREQLYDCRLIIYTQNEEIAQFFNNQVFPILLGRSTDLASVDSIQEIEIAEKETLDYVAGTIVPFKKHKLAATLCALPITLSDDIPRKIEKIETFYILDSATKQPYKLNAKGFNDSVLINSHTKKSVDLYWQEVLL